MRIKIPNVDAQTSRYRRKGDGVLVEKTRYYYRRGHGERIPLPGVPGSEEFMDRHRELEAQALAPSREDRIIAGTFEDLIVQFKRAPEYLELAEKTRDDYRRYIDIIAKHWGTKKVAGVRRKNVINLRDAYSTRKKTRREPDPKNPRKNITVVVLDEDGAPILEPTPRRANYLIVVAALLFKFSIDLELRENNPAAKIRKLKTGSGYAAWTEADVIAFLQSCPPVGMRRAMLMGLYTGQRGGDVVKMTWGQYDGTGIKLVQGKTGAQLWIPVHPELKTEMELIRKKKDAVTILTNANGNALTPNALRKSFRSACDKAGLSHLSFHGLRKLATSRLIDAGCSRDEVKAITGHVTDSMVAMYDRAGNQKARATAAIHSLRPIQGGKE